MAAHGKGSQQSILVFLPKRRQQAEEESERNTVPVPNDTDSPDYESDHPPLWSDSDDDSCSVATGTTDSTEASCDATSR